MQTFKKGEKNMSTKNFRSIVTLVAVLSLIVSGCSTVSYAADEMDTPTAALLEQTSAPQPTETAQPEVPDLVNAEALAVSIEDLVGIWFNEAYIEFKSDGNYAVYLSMDALQAGEKLDEGKYGMQGDQLWLGPMSRNCNGMGFYQLTSKSENELEFTKIREECSRSVGKIQRVMP